MGSALGCTASSSIIYSLVPEIGKMQTDFYCLNLSEHDVGKMYSVFISIDMNSNGYIESDELSKKLKLRATTFSDRIFNLFDMNHSGRIDFRSFVLTTWNFCTVEKTSLERLIFDMYDEDDGGAIETKHIHKFLKDIYGAEFKKNQNVQKAVDGLVEFQRSSNLMSADAFHTFCRRHAYILYPVTVLQSTLRDMVLGRDFWIGQAANRLEICDGQYIPFKVLFRELRTGRRDRTRCLESSEAVLRKQINSGSVSSSRSSTRSSKDEGGRSGHWMAGKTRSLSNIPPESQTE